VRKGEMIKFVDRAAVDIDVLRKKLPLVLERLDTYSSSGFTSSNGEGGGSSNPPGISSSPVERAAATPDPAADHRRKLERHLGDLATLLDDAMATVQWALAVDREDAGKPKPGCEIMAQVNVWEEATFTNAGGNLPERRWLGRWAREWVVRNGKLPTKAQAEQRAQGGKPRRAA